MTKDTSIDPMKTDMWNWAFFVAIEENITTMTQTIQSNENEITILTMVLDKARKQVMEPTIMLAPKKSSVSSKSLYLACFKILQE